MDQPLLRVKEAAQLLKVSKWTIYRWIDEGRLGATKIGGGSLRTFRLSVMSLVEENRTGLHGSDSTARGRVVRLREVKPTKR
ncbi:MAG: helix-turn-helix domain-containing protein [Nitrospira defluvii]|nr:helix-turn-helix domain-containing protein [Nitrospira defluvii]